VPIAYNPDLMRVDEGQPVSGTRYVTGPGGYSAVTNPGRAAAIADSAVMTLPDTSPAMKAYRENAGVDTLPVGTTRTVTLPNGSILTMTPTEAAKAAADPNAFGLTILKQTGTFPTLAEENAILGSSVTGTPNLDIKTQAVMPNQLSKVETNYLASGFSPWQSAVGAANARAGTAALIAEANKKAAALNATGFDPSGSGGYQVSNGRVLNEFGQPVDEYGYAEGSDLDQAPQLNSSLAAYALQLLRQQRGYAKGGEFTVREPAVVMGIRSGRPLAVVGEGLDRGGRPIPETLDATRNADGVFEVGVDPQQDYSYGRALTLAGVPGFAPPNVGLSGYDYNAGATTINGVRQQMPGAVDQSVVNAAVAAARQQAALEKAVQDALGIKTDGYMSQPNPTGGGGGMSQQEKIARQAELGTEQQIFNASMDPVDMINVARIRRQRQVNDYKYGLAGVPAPEGIAVPDASAVRGIPGVYAEPLSLADYLTKFVLPGRQIAVSQAALNGAR
jgi:hypothetical protein